MNQIASVEPIVLPIGTAHGGGHFAGLIRSNGKLFELVVAPRDGGEHSDIVWTHKRVSEVSDAMSFHDGRANTQAMAEAGSSAAKWALGVAIGGHTDWYIPSRDELELLYRAFKPTGDRNWAWRGDNPSSEPVGYAYTPTSPAKTEAAGFGRGEPEAFAPVWYWSSTQFAGLGAFAWAQNFDDGSQYALRKVLPCRVRAVRRLPIE